MVNLSEIKEIRGKRIRTSNNNLEAIMAFWQEVQTFGLKGDVYGICTQYESDYNGEYDLSSAVNWQSCLIA